MGHLSIVVVFTLALFQSTLHADNSKKAMPGECEAALTYAAKNSESSKTLEADISESAKSFRSYLDAIGNRLLERQEIIELIGLGLLAEEHVLIMGPPGNAKSMLSDEILGNILEADTGKNSYYRIQMTPETTMSETHGPINPKEILESGRIDRQYDQGILDKRNAFIDEIFDGRANALRNILGVLAERQHAQGGHIEQGKTETVIAATNRYIDEVYERAGDDGPRAVLDRFAFNAYVSGEFENSDSYKTLIRSAGTERPEIPEFTFQQLDTLRAMVKDVQIPDSVAEMLALISFRMKAEAESMEAAAVREYKKKIRNGEEPAPPYRSTKYHSPRTLYKAAKILKAMVVFDYAMSGGTRPLVANFKDLEGLRSFFTLNGPNQQFVEDLIDRTSNPYERSQLNAILTEKEMYETIYGDLYKQVNEVIYQHALADLVTLDFSDFAEKSEAEKQQMYNQIVSGIAETRLQIGMRTEAKKQAEVSAKDIGLKAVQDVLTQLLLKNFSAEQVETAEKEITQATETIVAEFREAEEKKAEKVSELQATIETAKKAIARISDELGEFLTEQASQAKFTDIVHESTGGDYVEAAVPYQIGPGKFVVSYPTMPLQISKNVGWWQGRDIHSELFKILSFNESFMQTAFEGPNGTLALINAEAVSLTSREDRRILRSDNVSPTGSLLSHFDAKEGLVYLADIGGELLTLKDTALETLSKRSLNNFSVKSGGQTTMEGDAAKDIISQVFADGGHIRSYRVGKTLFGVCPKKKAILRINLESGHTQLYTHIAEENQVIAPLSPDRYGNMYFSAPAAKGGQSSAIVYKVPFKYFEDGTENIEEFKLDFTTLPTGKETRYIELAIDSSGHFAIVPAYESYLKLRGVFVMDLKTGKAVSTESLLPSDGYYTKARHLGDDYFMIRDQNNDHGEKLRIQIAKLEIAGEDPRLKRLQEEIATDEATLFAAKQDLEALLGGTETGEGTEAAEDSESDDNTEADPANKENEGE